MLFLIIRIKFCDTNAFNILMLFDLIYNSYRPNVYIILKMLT